LARLARCVNGWCPYWWLGQWSWITRCLTPRSSGTAEPAWLLRPVAFAPQPLTSNVRLIMPEWTLILMSLSVMAISACARGPLVKAHFDNQVQQLCAIDGGVNVYQTVELPTEKFSQWGRVNFYKPTKGEEALGDNYLMKTEVKWIR